MNINNLVFVVSSTYRHNIRRLKHKFGRNGSYKYGLTTALPYISEGTGHVLDIIVHNKIYNKHFDEDFMEMQSNVLEYINNQEKIIDIVHEWVKKTVISMCDDILIIDEEIRED